ncbi:MAG: ABC transporter ATP-binding protein [Pseudodesulfovibrio sp.]|uniref:ABC transporter related protein n=1 Tax=Pseudodesulfovibrio aespoeensis (strain ATCC 700646 / DSM 10631 / Aspo-2) TaxID=643562 RepID=E6VWA8_PSEA9|nr:MULTISPECIES: ABC transporter ATP-binding protein [Pseudodesulfovibrio]MBU4192990.1 ABC transporter ATP-binding protein [Pseudomonadota bacterium]MCG2732782.1 ABC transporter ATP-binding protein [Pseudodesulfovibrio aespoeensis]ADU63668.1 ABC transporter related protein [Pseudodesulfovibrio aespoeensis Aspo-2]MBU4244951.1 ABC transporter ATP-binding protein [Pseudomonadota bacterium]MBU4378059.1 ABC transporter ATP-binding protein [Pseudomonadota bacterium]
MVEHVIEIHGLTLSFGGVPVLENVDLAVERGDFLAVLGPNGGGKSTLLKVMLGLLKPDSGTVRVLGASVGEAGGRIGYLPQHTHVSGSFPISVLDAVRMGMVSPGLGRIAGFGGGRDERERARRALERVDMLDHAQRALADLSGGQRQRVFIARAVVGDPELLLLDEPTASVDAKSRNSLFRLLAELNREMTVVMVSHDISSLASGVKSVACVNRTLHFHKAPALTGEMFKMGYGDDGEPCCPVELVTHGDVPHRVLGRHRDGGES